MIYLIGTLGFIGGFMLGLGIVAIFARQYSNEELLENKSIRFKYGITVWFFAFLCSGSSVWLYTKYLI